ncbi:F-box protein At2g16300-like [Capsella rubella]|uniref:F-box protein At2g16300-like n=1 Tax=Capsella rubella TaxID=81985 RepID=UPI000CD509DF|nr:F-box protein At2g16300-like [Capsella rubella]
MADWSLLPTDLLELIVGRSETSFEIVLLRSVCSSWRSVVPSPRDSPGLGIKTHIPMFAYNGNHHRLNGKPKYRTHDKCCTLKKVPIYLVRFKTPFGDDYLLTEIHERNIGEPMYLLSPLVTYDDETLKETLSFNSLNTRILPLCYYYKINDETYINFLVGVYRYEWSIPSKQYEWKIRSKKVEYLELNSDDCKDFILLADIKGDMIIFSSLVMRWTEIFVSPEKCRDMVSFKGKFYVVDTSGLGHVFVIEPSLEVSKIPSVIRSTHKSTKEALVKSGEELLLVQQFTPESLGWMKKVGRGSGFKLMT